MLRHFLVTAFAASNLGLTGCATPEPPPPPSTPISLPVEPFVYERFAATRDFLETTAWDLAEENELPFAVGIAAVVMEVDQIVLQKPNFTRTEKCAFALAVSNLTTRFKTTEYDPIREILTGTEHKMRHAIQQLNCGLPS